MPANGESMVGLTLEGLSNQFKALKAENETLKAEMACLSQHLADLEGNADGRTAPNPLPTAAIAAEQDFKSDPDHTVSRRGALRALGAAAAGGVGLAVGSTFLAVNPAAAADDAPVLLGESNIADLTTSVVNTNTTGASDAFSATSTAPGGSGLHGIDQSAPPVDSGYGVSGFSVSGCGIFGVSGGTSGVIAKPNTEMAGVFGDSDAGPGIMGTSSAFPGVAGQSIDDVGVTGLGFIGVIGSTNVSAPGGTDFSCGVWGMGSGQSPGVFASNTSPGPQLRLDPIGLELPTTSSPGQLMVLFDGSLWYSNNGDGAWIQLNKGFVNLLSSPIRIFDSRNNDPPAAPTRSSGPVAAESTTTLQVAGVSVGGLSVPDGASAVIGNVTATNVVADGWLMLYPAGPTPTASTPSNLNYQPSQIAVANFCIVALNGPGQMDIYSLAQTDVIFDVTGFVF